MHEVRPDRAPPAVEPHRPSAARRIMSVLSGLVSLGLVRVVLAVHRDDYLGAPVTIYVGLLVVAFGVGAGVLWFPKNQATLLRKILLGVVALAIITTGVFLVLLAD